MSLYFGGTSICVDPTNDIQLVIKQTKGRASCGFSHGLIFARQIFSFETFTTHFYLLAAQGTSVRVILASLFWINEVPQLAISLRPCTSLFVHVLKENVIKRDGVMDLWFIKSTLPYGSRHWSRFPNVCFMKGGQSCFFNRSHFTWERMLGSRDHKAPLKDGKHTSVDYLVS